MLKLLIVIGCCLPLNQAAFLQECEGVIISRVPNPNPECSEYVFCNGDDSYYCNDECIEPVSCNDANETTAQAAQSTTTTSTTITTVATEQPQQTDPNPTSTFEASSSSSSSSSTTTPTPSTTSTAASSTTVSSNNLQIICRRSGRDGVYPYPANDNYYYQCISGYLLLQQCPQHFHFDESLSKCIGTNPYL
ncbi:uncharacterized protein in LEU2 3'region [Drosophila grimshawi]|nr:uncharacterized protein in LEU2 3'region [Drosophila grimshawi]